MKSLPKGENGKFAAGSNLAGDLDSDPNLLYIRNVLSECADLSTYSSELERRIIDWPSEYQLSYKRANLLQAFDLSQLNAVLEIGCECGAITRALGEAGVTVDAIEADKEKAALARMRCRDLSNVEILSGQFTEISLEKGKYDAVLCIGVLNWARRFLPSFSGKDAVVEILKRLRLLLKQSGILMIAVENRLGLKYGLGASEENIVRPFAGIHGYPDTEEFRTYSKREWETILAQSDFGHYRFIYPFPDHKLSTVLLADNYLKADIRVFSHLSHVTSRDYSSGMKPRIEESSLWKLFAEAKCVEEFSNSFLIALSENSDGLEHFISADFVHISDVQRKPQYRTVKRKPANVSLVSKKRLVPGIDHSGSKLLIHNIGVSENFLDGNLLSEIWTRTLSIWSDLDKFDALVKEYFSFLQDYMREERNASRAVDLVPSNIVVDEANTYTPFDIEWEITRQITSQFILFRGLLHFINQNRDVTDIFPKHGFERIGDLIEHCFQYVGLNLFEHLDEFVETEDDIQREVLQEARFVDTRNELNQGIGGHKYHPRVSWRSRGEQFSSERMVSVTASFDIGRQRLCFKLPRGMNEIESVRFDVADSEGFFHIFSLELSFLGDEGRTESIFSVSDPHELVQRTTFRGMELRDGPIGEVFLSTTGDPQVFITLDSPYRAGNSGRYIFEAELSWPKGLEYLVAKSSFLRDEGRLRERIAVNEQELEKLRRTEKELKSELSTVKRSKGWRLIETLRRTFYVSALGKFPSAQKAALDLTRGAKSPGPSGSTGRQDIYDRYKAINQIGTEELESKYAELGKLSEKPKISVIIPVYNVDPKWLNQAISSVQRQIYSNWEICVIDDCSDNPATIDFLNHINDPKIKVRYLKENKNISRATNEGIKIASGNYIGFLDHDDTLNEDALFEVVKAINCEKPDLIYSDEDFIDPDRVRINPHFKPDFSPDLLLSHNYVTHFLVVKKELAHQVGLFRSEYDGAQDYDFVLRASERAAKIHHIPKILYHWRMIEQSTSLDPEVKPESPSSAKRAIEDAIRRRGSGGTVLNANLTHFFRVKRDILGNPLVSIIVPFKDKPHLLKRCFDAILTKSTYKNFELIGISNNSEGADVFRLMNAYEGEDSRIRFVELNIPFSFSAIVNHGVSLTRGEHIILMNNDIEVMTWEWIEGLLEHSQRDEVGVVGGKLYFPDNTIQHAGIVVGIRGYAGHPHKGFPSKRAGYFNKLNVIHNVSAVTGAFMMVKKRIYEAMDGFDEDHLAIACNDVDFCLRILNAGYYNVFTPYVEAYHWESSSRGYEDTPEKKVRFDKERRKFVERHREFIEAGDPFYNPNLSLADENYSIKL